MRPVISFDLDGVIAEGGYMPYEERTEEAYQAKKFIDRKIDLYLNYLADFYDIYIISFRHHEGANLGARQWFMDEHVGMDTLAGVITHPASPEVRDGNHLWKGETARVVGSQFHLDDDPRVVKSCEVGVLFDPTPNELRATFPQDFKGIEAFPSCHTWEEVVRFLTTPGARLSGINRSIDSPAPPSTIPFDLET